MNFGEPAEDIVLFLHATGPSEEKLTAAIKTVLDHHPEILFAWLYGSFTRDEPFQDIDLAVFISQTARDLDPYAIYKLQMQVAREVQERITPSVPIDVRVLNDAPVEFQYEVICSGRLVFDRDREKRTEFEADIISRYLDLRYLLDRVDPCISHRGDPLRRIAHLNALSEALDDWERYQSIPVERFRDDRDTRNMVLHGMLVAIQSAIDIATDTIAEEGLKRPSSYRETFVVLANGGILTQELAHSLSDLAGFRNALVHIYWDLDLLQVYAILTHDLSPLKEFLRVMKSIKRD